MLKKSILAITMLLVLSNGVTSAQKQQIDIQRVEPAFWWVGMKNPELQLLVYGKDIATAVATLQYEGVEITRTEKTENPNYQFIYLTINNTAKPGKFPITFQVGKKKRVFTYELKQREKAGEEYKGFTSSDVIYLIMPDRFANGNPANDSHPETSEEGNRDNANGRHGGDIDGIIKNLDYLHDLGVTSLWSTPLLEDNEPAYSYHGYAQTNYYKIDPRYGTNNDYKRLADELHKRNMKLILDYVTNHWGISHWMIKDIPEKSWIHSWADGKNGFKRSNYAMTTHFDINASQSDADGCMNGWFDTSMPDINQSNPKVVDYMVQNAIWWIEYAKLDGLRVDTYPYNDKKGITEWTKRIMDEYPNFNIVGEVWMHDQAQMSYWQKDSKISAIEGFNSYLPSIMDFTLHDAIGAFNEDSGHGLFRIYENFTNDFLYPDINNIMTFAGNHDTNRINQTLNGDLDKYKLATALILTCRGIPQLYYGDEIGMMGSKSVGDGDIRRDFPGGWSEDKQNAFNTEGRTQEQQAYYDFTHKLLNWRKEKEVIHTGKTMHYLPFENEYVYFRYNESETVMVILNNNKEAKTLDTKRFTERLTGYTSGKNIVTNETVTNLQNISLPAKSATILELKK
jgi:glycosidase